MAQSLSEAEQNQNEQEIHLATYSINVIDFSDFMDIKYVIAKNEYLTIGLW